MEIIKNIRRTEIGTQIELCNGSSVMIGTNDMKQLYEQFAINAFPNSIIRYRLIVNKQIFTMASGFITSKHIFHSLDDITKWLNIYMVMVVALHHNVKLNQYQFIYHN